jgi:hypothetical protein
MDVARDPGKAKATGRKLRPKDRPLANDSVSDAEFDRLLDAWFGNAARVLQPGRGFYIWGGYVNCGNYPPFLKKHGLYFSQAITWLKEHPVLTRKDFMGNHDWIGQIETLGAVDCAGQPGAERPHEGFSFIANVRRPHTPLLGPTNNQAGSASPADGSTIGPANLRSRRRPQCRSSDSIAAKWRLLASHTSVL